MEAKGRMLTDPVFKVTCHDGDITIRVDCNEHPETWYELVFDRQMCEILSAVSIASEKLATAVSDLENHLAHAAIKYTSRAPGTEGGT